MTAAPSRAWTEYAACYGIPDDVFYGDDTSRGWLGATQLQVAKRICGGCPVRAECLDWALRTREPWGVFGGFTAPERARMLGWNPRGGGPAQRAANWLNSRSDPPTDTEVTS